MQRSRIVAVGIALAAFALAPASGCFNGSFQQHHQEGAGGGNRFELVVEPNRTTVEGTHFLVDRATGDMWRLDARGGVTGVWVRLADGPEDVTPLETEEEHEDQEEAAEES